MACCGTSRAPLFGPGTVPSQKAPASSSGARRYRVQFEYVGRTALTVIGPVSGTRYRFVQPGAVVTVDARDRPGLAAVPNLRSI
jgi:hypothetical protein